jgi:hypothetical protein
MDTAYVYAITVDDVVRYIGKGRRYRVREHYRIARLILRKRSAGKKIKSNRFYNRLAKAMASRQRVDEAILASGLSDADAFQLERRLIAGYPTGQLWNVAPGGEGYTPESARAAWTPERRERQREIARRRWADPEQRKRHSDTIKAQWEDPAYRQHHIAKQIERWAEPGARERGSEITQAVWASPERRERQSVVLKEYWAEPEHREQRIAHNRRLARARRKAHDSSQGPHRP